MGNFKTIGLLGAVLLIVAAGLLLPAHLLRRQQDALFGGALKLSENTLMTENAGESIVAKAWLNKEELFAIAKSIVSTSDLLYHDPLQGQMNMQEAVAVCLEAMRIFAEKGILPPEFLRIEENWGANLYSNFHASLATKVYEGNPARPVDAENSVWRIGFSTDQLSIELYMDARTGQVLWLRVRNDNVKTYTQVSQEEGVYELVELAYPAGLNVEQILTSYLEYVGLDISEAAYIEVDSTFAGVVFPLETEEGKVRVELRIGDNMGYAYLDIAVF